MKITIINNSLRTFETKKIEVIAKVIIASFKVHKYKKADVYVYVTDNYFIKKLNKKYRNKDKVTDVLSFPIREKNYLGDIIFSIEKMEEQAKQFGHSKERELGFFIAHSMLHMFGYDHSDEMFKIQEKILNKADLYR